MPKRVRFAEELESSQEIDRADNNSPDLLAPPRTRLDGLLEAVASANGPTSIIVRLPRAAILETEEIIQLSIAVKANTNFKALNFTHAWVDIYDVWRIKDLFLNTDHIQELILPRESIISNGQVELENTLIDLEDSALEFNLKQWTPFLECYRLKQDKHEWPKLNQRNGNRPSPLECIESFVVETKKSYLGF